MRSVRRIVAAAPDRAARYQASRDCTAQVLTTTPAAAGSDRSKNTASENTEPPGKLWVAHGRIPLSFPVHARLRSSAFILMHWAADWRSALCPAEVLEQACRGGRCWEQEEEAALRLSKAGGSHWLETPVIVLRSGCKCQTPAHFSPARSPSWDFLIFHYFFSFLLQPLAD